MARDQAVLTATPSSWVQLTNADVSAISFQALTAPIYIRVTTDATTPTEERGVLYAQGQGEASKSLSDIVGLTGAARVWAKAATSQDAMVWVDHA